MRKSYRRRGRKTVRNVRRIKKRTARHRRRRGGAPSSPKGEVLATPWKRDIINRAAPAFGVQKGKEIRSSRRISPRTITVGPPTGHMLSTRLGLTHEQITAQAQTVAAQHKRHLQSRKNPLSSVARGTKGLVTRLTRKLRGSHETIPAFPVNKTNHPVIRIA